MSNVYIRVDDNLKREAERVFSEVGLSISTATNAFYRQAVRHGGIPFELRRGPVEKPVNERVTLEKVFQGWDGDLPEPYDWGEMEAPTGKELL